LAVPGAYALVWALPKEQHLTAHCIEEAGWTIKDVIAHHFGTGQPHSRCLKPATEFWTLAQWGTGRRLNIDECMILDPTNLPMKWSKPRGGFWNTQPVDGDAPKLIQNTKGRHPANVMIDDFIAEYMPRFFYVRKVLGKARTIHPTEKSVELMRYLVRLISYPGETILDPFMGSGSTGVAAIQEGRNFVGIEENAEYHAAAIARFDDPSE